ncbi:MAG: hypothetical protein ACOC4M_02495 [Promethearchaeia archaeon]
MPRFDCWEETPKHGEKSQTAFKYDMYDLSTLMGFLYNTCSKDLLLLTSKWWRCACRRLPRSSVSDPPRICRVCPDMSRFFLTVGKNNMIETYSPDSSFSFSLPSLVPAPSS